MCLLNYICTREYRRSKSLFFQQQQNVLLCERREVFQKYTRFFILFDLHLEKEYHIFVFRWVVGSKIMKFSFMPFNVRYFPVTAVPLLRATFGYTTNTIM